MPSVVLEMTSKNTIRRSVLKSLKACKIKKYLCKHVLYNSRYCPLISEGKIAGESLQLSCSCTYLWIFKKISRQWYMFNDFSKCFIETKYILYLNEC